MESKRTKLIWFGLFASSTGLRTLETKTWPLDYVISPFYSNSTPSLYLSSPIETLRFLLKHPYPALSTLTHLVRSLFARLQLSHPSPPLFFFFSSRLLSASSTYLHPTPSLQPYPPEREREERKKKKEKKNSRERIRSSDLSKRLRIDVPSRTAIRDLLPPKPLPSSSSPPPLSLTNPDHGTSLSSSIKQRLSISS